MLICAYALCFCQFLQQLLMKRLCLSLCRVSGASSASPGPAGIEINGGAARLVCVYFSDVCADRNKNKKKKNKRNLKTMI